MKQKLRTLVSTLATIAFIAPAAQAEGDWKFELVPYAWLAGIDGDISAGEREAEVDIGFDDLLDATEIGGSFLAVTQYKRFVLFTQFDYFQLDTDELDDSPDIGHIENDSLFLSGAFGYQFNTFGEHSTIDVLGGVRYLDMENDLYLADGRRASGSSELIDGIFMLRPSFQLLSWLRFNPTLSVGAGDSDLTYELQPQFQIQFTDNIVARLGYRRLYYDVSGERADFDGSFHGLIAGLGVTF
jgi:hypothetical protein